MSLRLCYGVAQVPSALLTSERAAPKILLSALLAIRVTPFCSEKQISLDVSQRVEYRILYCQGSSLLK